MIVTICWHDTVHLRISCEEAVARELDDHFKFLVPNHRFHPLVKKRRWDGYIHLFSLKRRVLYAGLYERVVEFCQDRAYEIVLDGDFSKTELPIFEARAFIDTLNIPSQFEHRDYQIESFVHCVRNHRALMISPTSSGKSLIMYYLTRFLDRRTLIIVPTTTLVHQLAEDFASYGYTEPVHKIYSGQEKYTGEKIVITTWQSAYKESPEWFQTFQVLIADECHHLKAKSLVELMEKTPTIFYKFGFTGSLDGSEHSQMTLEGLLGPLQKVTETRTLIDQGYIADLNIKSIILLHPAEHAKLLRPKTKEEKAAAYRTEIDFLVEHPKRNKFIANLALSLPGNTLILYRYVEKHGFPLYNILHNRATIPVHFIYGGVEAEERNAIRGIVDRSKQSITIASQGTMSEGVSIININNLIFASPSKSRILILQSLGRGMRKSHAKSICNVFDISDDLTCGKYINHTMRHLAARLQYYIEEQFNYEIYKVKL